MAQLLGIFGFLSVVLRGLTLAFEALTVGGVIFRLFIARTKPPELVYRRLNSWNRIFALALAAVEVCLVCSNTGILMVSTDLRLSDVVTAGFFIAGMFIVAGSISVACLAGGKNALASHLSLVACLLILLGSVMTSHSVGRVEDRGILVALTAVHHVAGAAWIGGMPYLLIALRHLPTTDGANVTNRFSRCAAASVAALVVAGAGLSYFYAGSTSAMTGTTYGIMLLSKIAMMILLLGLGALNFTTVRAIRKGQTPGLLPLQRFAEVEVGIGFTVLLTAASLTSTPPAIDVQTDRVSPSEIATRMKPVWPRMNTPRFEELSPASPLQTSLPASAPGSFVPGQVSQPSTPADIEWSEYNHHWSGLVVLAIGIASLLVVRFSWARHWPLLFFGLSMFLLIRADSENWPLGPRGFWESFQVAEVAQHRLFVLLIIAFAIFEWSVQTGRLNPQRGGLVFPLVCAVGGALLLTHSHSLGNVKEEFLAELSHIPLAILAVIAGWSRWLEIRAPQRRHIVQWIWPMCFILIGAMLLNYRES